MAETCRATGYVLDPHSAVGTRAARELLGKQPAIPVIALSTAHPAKFPDAVERATGLRPALPPHMADLMTQRRELHGVAERSGSRRELSFATRARAASGIAA